MPRHPRIHAPNLLYHLITRGNNGQKIFLAKEDYEKFLFLLALTKERYPFKLYAYVLMPNHFHLLLEVKEKPTSRIMQSLLTGYSVYFNKAYKRRGHLFQGRYKGIVCDKDNYFIELAGYIHLNPVRAKLVAKPGAWRWSGHQEYLGMSKNNLIDPGLPGGTFGKGEKGYRNYKRLLEDRLGEGFQEKYYPKDIRPFLGDDIFVAQVKEPKREVMMKKDSLEKILAELAEKAGVKGALIQQKLKMKKIAGTRKEFIRKSILENGYLPAEVARFLNCSPVYVSRVARGMDKSSFS